MQLTVVGRDPMTELCRQWRDALSVMSIEHPNRESTVLVKLVDDLPPRLTVSLDWTRDTVTGKRRESFQISTVRLCYFPGVRLAQAWLAAAWAGYVLHESLEMVTADGVRPIDPHEERPASPHRLSPQPFDRGLRDGLPQLLTRETLIRTLLVVMDEDAAREFVGV